MLEATPDLNATSIIIKFRLVPITVGPTETTLLTIKSDFSRDATSELIDKFK